jgi:hypothetical protein
MRTVNLMVRSAGLMKGTRQEHFSDGRGQSLVSAGLNNSPEGLKNSGMQRQSCPDPLIFVKNTRLN